MRDQDTAMKAAVKEAIKEFLEEKWKEYTSSIGKWFLGIVAAALLGALLWLVLTANGWRAPQ